MKKYLIIFCIFFIFVLVNLTGCSSPEYGIRAEIIDTEPIDYVNISEQQIKDYPNLKKAIISVGEIIITPGEEWEKINNLLQNKDTKYIYYQNEYFKITLSIACL
jgi:hypothetical protein